MSAFCRFTTAVALLLHLFFGCSMHHAVACGGHDHDGCQHVGAVDESPSVHAGHHHHSTRHGACEHHSDVCDSNPNERSAYAHDSVCDVGCDCQSDPCDGDHPGCHGGAGCSFVNSHDVQFVIEMPTLSYLDTHLYCDDLRGAAFKTGAVADDVGWTAIGSRYHCALLCTWVI